MRFNLAGSSYKAGADAVENSTGCGGNEGVNACSGYELTRSLDFADGASYASGRVNSDWRPNSANNGAGDNAGWPPIGNNSTNNTNSRFTATFEGNGFTISNLYARGDDNANHIGLFGYADGATLRKIGIAGTNLHGGSGDDTVGGLAGSVDNSSSITVSYATGNINGNSDNDTIGGLVGSVDNSSSIIASYTNVTVNGDAGTDNVSGLVALANNSSSITASYATGNVDGGDSTSDGVGGLIRFLRGGATITASYATGDVSGGDGTSDFVGRLAALNVGGTITASYGFGGTSNGTANTLGAHPNSAVKSATALTEAGTTAPTSSTTNAGTQWGNSQSTDWDWDFGTNTQNPALVVDFNGDGTPTWQEFGNQPRQ